MSEASDQITEYLSVGGLFNPEMMNQTQHEAVRNTLIKARDDIQRLESENAKLRDTVEQWKCRFYDVADAICRESTGIEDLCRQARALRAENIALRTEIKSALDALNTAANEGGFDGYDEDTPLLVNLKSHWDRLYMTYDKELQRLKRVNADLFAWKEGKKGIEEYYSMVSQRDAARAENAALRADIHAHEQINKQLIEDKRRLDWLLTDDGGFWVNWMYEKDEWTPELKASRDAIDACRNRRIGNGRQP